MIKKAVFAAVVLFFCVWVGFFNVRAQIIETGHMKKTKMKADYMDFWVYPPESLQGKGALYIDCGSLSERIAFEVTDGGAFAGTLYIGGGKTALYKKEMSGSGEQNAGNRTEEIPLVFNDVFNAFQEQDFYMISARVLFSGGYETISLRISRRDAESQGFIYVPLEKVIEICRENKDMANGILGTEIMLSPQELRKAKERDGIFPVYGLPGEEIVRSAKEETGQPAKRKIYMLRTKPQLSAPFVNITEPRINEIRTLFKKDYWYELEVSAFIPFVTTDGKNEVYRGKTYRGFWQAQYDGSGFPVLLTSMVDNKRWKELAQRYKRQQEKR